jgi:hypothetical protein
LTGTDHGALGRLNHMNFTSQWRWTYRPGNCVKINKKSPSGKVWTFSNGGTPQLPTFRSKKPTTYRGNIRNRPRRASRVRSGTQNSGLRCPSSYGSQSKTTSSLGTILENEVL